MDRGGLLAATWGLVAGSSFLVGGMAGLRLRPSRRVIGLWTGVGAGALLAAVAFKLVDEAGRLAGGSGRVGLGLIVGSVVSLVASGHWRSTDEHVEISLRALAVTVVAESVVIVGTLLGGHDIKLAVVASVFVCGVPEAMRATGRLSGRGLPPVRVLLVWTTMTLLCALSAGVAYVLLDPAPEGAVAFVLAAAGGSVLTEITTELIPDARALAGWLAGPTVVVGFGTVFWLVEVT